MNWSADFCYSCSKVGEEEDRLVAVYDKLLSGTDEDYCEWYCGKLKRKVQDNKIPNDCPYCLERIVMQG